jgi:AGCS family alanine or glycine:cation symporter
MLDVNQIINDVSAVVSGWPLIIFLAGAALFCTIAFNFVQVRYFLDAWKVTLFPKKNDADKAAALSPLQAFLNSLSMSLGNGTIAGVAVAINSGGPGSIFWLVCTGALLMAVRFAEVYLSIYFQDVRSHVGGPMLYIKSLFGGPVLAYMYALLAVGYAFVSGNVIQVNAIAWSLQEGWQINPYIIAAGFFCLVLYTMLGGAKRILTFSDAIVPLKVILFVTSISVMLVYHWAALVPAFVSIVKSAFSGTAFFGGVAGFSVQQAMQSGMLRSVMSSEAGLGTSGIFFGASGSKHPMEDSLMGMLSTFISTFFCFLMGLVIVASDAWSSGLLTNTPLTIAAFKTAFGPLAIWVVTILALTFGIGLIVSYAFVARSLWAYLTGGKFLLLGNLLYCACAVIGALIDPKIAWVVGDIINAGMIVINVGAIIVLSKIIKDGINAYAAQNAKA